MKKAKTLFLPFRKTIFNFLEELNAILELSKIKNLGIREKFISQ